MRAIPLVHVEIHHEHARNCAIGAQAAGCDDHIVERAEALGGIGEGVMRAAAQIHRSAVVKRHPRRRDGGAHAAPPPLHQTR